jgi:hypothetical protein
MAEDAVRAARRHKPTARKFYRMGPNLRVGGKAGFRLENEMVLTGGRPVLVAPPGRGFPSFPEAPRLVIDKKLGRPLRDIELYSGYWLVSDRMKTLLEVQDPAAVAFVRCDVHLADGAAGPAYWLCDVVRVLDAVDEARSRLRIYYDDEDDESHKAKVYSLSGGADVVFNEDVVGTAHLFRMAHMEPAVICDQLLKEACSAASLKGVRFRDVHQL